MSATKLPTSNPLPAPASVPQVGHVCGLGPAGQLMVEVAGHRRIARTTLMISAEEAEQASERGQTVLVLFENGDAELPIVIGFVQAEPPAPVSLVPDGGAVPTQVEAKVDGRRVVLEAQDELELRCGEAQVILRRNGRVLVRGTYVETHSKGVNRIKGGSVSIN